MQPYGTADHVRADDVVVELLHDEQCHRGSERQRPPGLQVQQATALIGGEGDDDGHGAPMNGPISGTRLKSPVTSLTTAQ